MMAHPVIPALNRKRQGDCQEFKATLWHIVSYKLVTTAEQGLLCGFIILGFFLIYIKDQL